MRPPGDPIQRRQVSLLVETVLLRLAPEQLAIHRLILKEELPQEDIPHMTPVNHNRRRHIPHVIFAFVELIRARLNARREFDITLHAMAAGIRMHAVELGADVLPARSDQHLAGKIDEGNTNIRQRIEIVHQGLDGLHVDDVGEFKSAQVAIGREHADEFLLRASFARLQRLFRFLALGDVAHGDQTASQRLFVTGGHLPRYREMAAVALHRPICGIDLDPRGAAGNLHQFVSKSG